MVTYMHVFVVRMFQIIQSLTLPILAQFLRPQPLEVYNSA